MFKIKNNHEKNYRFRYAFHTLARVIIMTMTAEYASRFVRFPERLIIRVDSTCSAKVNVDDSDVVA